MKNSKKQLSILKVKKMINIFSHNIINKMGNIFRKKSKRENEIESLKKRLTSLENIDTNKDGIITKDEFTKWSKNQKEDIKEFKKVLETQIRDKIEKEELKKLTDAKYEIAELRKQIDSLKAINKILKDKMNSDGVQFNQEAYNQKVSDLLKLSKIRINQFVEKILEDENVNIKYLPDFVERQIYRNVFTILINLLENILETTSIKFLGHNLTFDINPNIEDDIDNNIKKID